MAGIYIHIPYCRQKCHYCNFHFSTSLKSKNDMLLAIQRELVLAKDYLHGASIETVYLGGGTPSLLSPQEIQSIWHAITENFPVTQLLEFTMETNPDDLNSEYLALLRELTPVNRLSIGIQSFRDEDLQYMNRAHNAEQAIKCIQLARESGFDNLTVDLIYGIPGLSNEAWRENLERVLQLQVPHVSAYALTVEEGTALSYAIRKGKQSNINDADAAAHFNILLDLTASYGYLPYEISNLALPGHEAVHNTNYWKGVPYLGIGPSAHSYNGHSRRWNVANNMQYIHTILQLDRIPYEEEQLTVTQQINEYIMTSLRTIWGCDLQYIHTQWGEVYVHKIMNAASSYMKQQWLRKEQEKIVLTRSGKLFADAIAAELFVD